MWKKAESLCAQGPLRQPAPPPGMTATPWMWKRPCWTWKRRLRWTHTMTPPQRALSRQRLRLQPPQVTPPHRRHHLRGTLPPHRRHHLRGTLPPRLPTMPLPAAIGMWPQRHRVCPHLQRTKISHSHRDMCSRPLPKGAHGCNLHQNLEPALIVTAREESLLRKTSLRTPKSRWPS